MKTVSEVYQFRCFGERLRTADMNEGSSDSANKRAPSPMNLQTACSSRAVSLEVISASLGIAKNGDGQQPVIRRGSDGSLLKGKSSDEEDNDLVHSVERSHLPPNTRGPSESAAPLDEPCGSGSIPDSSRAYLHRQSSCQEKNSASSRRGSASLHPPWQTGRPSPKPSCCGVEECAPETQHRSHGDKERPGYTGQSNPLSNADQLSNIDDIEGPGCLDEKAKANIDSKDLRANGTENSTGTDSDQRRSGSAGSSHNSPSPQQMAAGMKSSDDEPDHEEKEHAVPWTMEQHRAFVSAVFEMGLKHCSPSVLLDEMKNVPKEISRENIKSHLQKYRKLPHRSLSEFMGEYDDFLRRTREAERAHAVIIKSDPDGDDTRPSSPIASPQQCDRSTILSEVLGGEDPEQLLGGSAAAYAAYSVGNNCPPKNEIDQVLFEATEEECPIVTEDEQETPIGKSLMQVKGALEFLKEFVLNARYDVPMKLDKRYPPFLKQEDVDEVRSSKKFEGGQRKSGVSSMHGGTSSHTKSMAHPGQPYPFPFAGNAGFGYSHMYPPPVYPMPPFDPGMYPYGYPPMFPSYPPDPSMAGTLAMAHSQAQFPAEYNAGLHYQTSVNIANSYSHRGSSSQTMNFQEAGFNGRPSPLQSRKDTNTSVPFYTKPNDGKRSPSAKKGRNQHVESIFVESYSPRHLKRRRPSPHRASSAKIEIPKSNGYSPSSRERGSSPTSPGEERLRTKRTRRLPALHVDTAPDIKATKSMFDGRPDNLSAFSFELELKGLDGNSVPTTPISHCDPNVTSHDTASDNHLNIDWETFAIDSEDRRRSSLPKRSACGKRRGSGHGARIKAERVDEELHLDRVALDFGKTVSTPSEKEQGNMQFR